jgi:hypothetical protein
MIATIRRSFVATSLLVIWCYFIAKKAMAIQRSSIAKLAMAI